MFTFCALQGALSESLASQSLLELDGGVKVLIDIGWDESFDTDKLAELEKRVPTISLILLTHATVSHLAAYAHCCKNIALFTRIPVYATRPVIDLGRTMTQDLYSSAPAAATTIRQSSLSETAYAYSQVAAAAVQDFLLQSPSADEIARYFSLIQPLKYSQPHQPLSSPFSPPLNGLTITAYNSGHTLGGTIWHIQHGLESIVYAVDWNQARENVFAGAAWLGGAGGGSAEVIEQLRQPTALVCSSRGAEKTAQAGGRARRDEQLLETIKACVSRGGTVLIPVDSSARVLEMAYLLEHAWRADAASNKDGGVLRSSKLYLAGRNVSSTMRYARSMLEWMDNNIVQEFESSAERQRKVNGGQGQDEGGPFHFRWLRLLERKAQIARLLGHISAAPHGETAGRVILATDASLDWGLSKDLFRVLARDTRNLVILTERPGAAEGDRPSISRTLWEWWRERRDGVSAEQGSNGDSLEMVYAGGREVEVREARRQPLEGEELAMYQQWLATQRQLQATQQAGGAGGMEASADVVDDASSDSSSSESESEEGEQQGKALNLSTTMGQASRKKVVLRDEDLGINILIKRKAVYDFDPRAKKGRDRSFPMAIRRKRADDFGDLIRPEDYLRAEEKEEEAGAGAGAVESGHGHGTEDDRLGKKRKWGDVAARQHSGGSHKRPSRVGRTIAGDRDGDVDMDQGATGGAGGSAAAADDLDAVDEAEPEEASGPCKLAYESETVAVRLRIAMVDFSGLHDKRSLNMLIPLIQPRKLILVGGTAAETNALAADCRGALGGEGERRVDVFTPAVGSWVDASMDTNAWIVKLADPLVKTLKWQNVRGLGIVTITGQLLAAAVSGSTTHQDGSMETDEDEANKRQKTEPVVSSTAVALTNAANTGAMPMLDVLPANLVSAARSVAQSLHVGDLRLADLRRSMQGAGNSAEFRGEGTLVVDGEVAVRKTAEGRIEVESVGVPGRTVYEVKRAIYDTLAVVGA